MPCTLHPILRASHRTGLACFRSAFSSSSSPAASRVSLASSPAIPLGWSAGSACSGLLGGGRSCCWAWLRRGLRLRAELKRDEAADASVSESPRPATLRGRANSDLPAHRLSALRNCAQHFHWPPTWLGDATGRKTVRTISVASRAASDCSFDMACRLSSSMRGAGLLDLLLGSDAGLIDSLAAGLVGLLTASFLVFEDFLARFAEALLVFGGAGFGGGDVGARFFHCSLGAAAALGEHRGQGTMDHKSIKNVKHCQQNDRGHGSEQ